MVDDVVHEEAADDGAAGHGEDDAFAAAERPHVAHRFVFHFGDCFAGGGDVRSKRSRISFVVFSDGVS